MITEIQNAFADLDAKLHAADQEFAAAKIDTARQFVEEAKAAHKAGDVRYTAGYGRFCTTTALIAHFGSKGMMNLLTGHGREGALANMAKNTESLIAKRNSTIVKALEKKGITELPAFTLAETSDGYEGYFNVAGHTVTIRTILAGGYNIQRLHQRTITKVQ